MTFDEKAEKAGKPSFAVVQLFRKLDKNFQTRTQLCMKTLLISLISKT